MREVLIELSARGWVCEGIGIGPVFVGKCLSGCIIEKIVILLRLMWKYLRFLIFSFSHVT